MMHLECSGCIESTKSWRRDFVVIVCQFFIGCLSVQKYIFKKRKARLVFLSQLLLATFCNECDKSYIILVGSMCFNLGRSIIDLVRSELCSRCFIWKSLILEFGQFNLQSGEILSWDTFLRRILFHTNMRNSSSLYSFIWTNSKYLWNTRFIVVKGAV